MQPLLPAAGTASSEAGQTANFVGLVGVLPGKLGFGAAEVAVSGGFTVNGPQQIEVTDDGPGPQVPDLADDVLDAVFGHQARAHEVHHDGDRLGHADGIGDLDFAFLRHPGGHDVLGDMAGHVRGAAIDLGRILAGKTAAPMASLAAVGVHDDFPTGQAAVAHGPAHHETARGIDEIPGVAVDHRFGDFLFDDLFDDGFAQVVVGHVGFVLGGNDHGVHPFGLAVFIFDGHLGLAVGTQKVQGAVFSHRGQSAGEFVGVHDGHGHEFGGFVGGKTEHQPLVPGPLFGKKPLVFIDALGDVERLVIDAGDHRTGLPVKAHLGGGVADIADGLPDNLGHFHVAIRGDLAGDKRDTGGDHGFASDPAFGILGHDGIEDGIGNGVGHFVRMAFGDGFGCKEKLFFAHEMLLLFLC